MESLLLTVDAIEMILHFREMELSKHRRINKNPNTSKSKTQIPVLLKGRLRRKK